MEISKKNIITFAACLFLLLSIASVSGLSEDFSASAGKTVYVGECSTSVNKILVINTGDISSSYSVSVEGEAAKWASYAPSSFILKSEERKGVYVNLKVPCNTLKGSYSLETYITTGLGRKKVIKQEVKVHEVQNIQIEPVLSSITMNPCQTANFRFNVKNTGDFPETYHFEANRFKENIVFSHQDITIGGGKSQQVLMHVSPACNVWGKYSLKITTSAKRSGTVAQTVGIKLNINRDYDFLLEAGELYVPEEGKAPEAGGAYAGNYFFCEEEYGTIPVFIKNTASVANKYYFELDGRGWTTLSGNVAELNPGQGAYVNIDVVPPKVLEDDFDIVLNVNTYFGGIRKILTKRVVVDNCHIPEIAEGTSRIKAYYAESTAELILENTGSKTANYNLEVEGADWITIEPSNIQISGGEEKSFRLNLKPTAETEEGKYLLTIKATVAESGLSYVKEVVVSIKEPRFANMIFDEYLVFTILFIILLIALVGILVVVMIHLEKTKDERVVRAEERRKENERLRLEREKEKEKKRIEREKEAEKRRVEKEKRKLDKENEREARQKEKEKLRLEKENEREKRKLEKERLKIEKGQEKENRKAEKEKLKLEKQREKEAKKLDKEKDKEQRRKEKEELKFEKARDKEQRRLEKQAEKEGKTVKPIAEKKIKIKPREPIVKFDNIKDKIKANSKWIKWVVLGIIILLAVVILALLAYKLILVLIVYYLGYLIRGLIAAVIVAVLLVFGEAIFGKFYKRQSWETLAARQKAVVPLSWKKGLGEVVIRLKRGLQTISISVRRNIIRPTFIAAGEKVYQYFEIRKKGFDNEDIDKVSFRFRVKKKWLKKHDIPYRTVKLVRYNNDQWIGVRTEVAREDKWYFYYIADSSACSVFAIIGKPKPAVEKPKPLPKMPKSLPKAFSAKKVAEKIAKPKKLPKPPKPPKLKKTKKPFNWKPLKTTGMYILIALVVAIIVFGAFYVIKSIPPLVDTDENVSEYESDDVEVEVVPEEDEVEEPEPEEEINETEEAEEPDEEEEEEAADETEEEEKPGLWSRFVAWLKGFVQRVDVPEEELNETEEPVEDEIEEEADEITDELDEVEDQLEDAEEAEEPIEDDIDDVIIDEEPEEEQEEVEAEDVEEVPENETVEELPEEEFDEKPGLWSKFTGWIKGLFEREEAPEEEINETEEAEEPDEEEVIEEEPEEEEFEGGILPQEWNKNTQHTIDLSEYFQDPDNDVLTYTYTSLDNIEIGIDENGIATLTPEADWFGKEYATFTADDGKGGVVSSNNVRLEVLDREGKPLGQWLKDSISIYSNYVMIGLLILIILILLIEFRKPIMKFLEED